MKKKTKLKVLYQIPSLYSLYAGRTIYFGYKHAFTDLGHEFRPVTADDNFKKVIEEYKPDILITGLNPYNLKFLDLEVIKKERKRGLKVFVNIPFWHSPFSKLRLSEFSGLDQNKEYVNLIKNGEFGDVYYNICEKDDPRMDGFEKATGKIYNTILLAADKTILFPDFDEKFKADISFIGTYLPGKKKFIDEQVFPLSKNYDLKLYGQDWTAFDKYQNFIHKVGQYFNVPYLKKFKKPALQIEDERRIYSSSLISINIHEDYQKEFGGDCNERTFKVPLCGGFEITDDVACIRKYFEDNKEMIIAKNKEDWFSKIEYYMKNPEKRIPIIEAGKKRVLKDHTYHNRVNQIVELYFALH